jgi:hypothetical protein
MAFNMQASIEEDFHGRLCFSDDSFPEIASVTQKEVAMRRVRVGDSIRRASTYFDIPKV